jgi:hypothetical protein
LLSLMAAAGKVASTIESPWSLMLVGHTRSQMAMAKASVCPPGPNVNRDSRKVSLM